MLGHVLLINHNNKRAPLVHAKVYYNFNEYLLLLYLYLFLDYKTTFARANMYSCWCLGSVKEILRLYSTIYTF